MSLAIALLAFLPSSARASASLTRYAVDPGASRMVAHVGKTGLFWFAGHEHQVVVPLRQGALNVDRTRLERSSVELTFQTAALWVDPRGEPSGDPPKVRATMLGPRCLDAARYPVIVFRSGSIVRVAVSGATADVTIRGVLTLHGVSRTLDVPAHVAFTGDAFTANGAFSLRQSDFGIEPISVAAVVKVKDQVQVSWTLAGHRAP